MFRLRCLLLFAALLGGVARAEMSGPLINRRNEMLVFSDGRPARLRNNPAARDRSLAEVLAFVARDKTNRRAYLDSSFMCTEFAIALHDRAEAEGIRCGIVSLSFARGVGHALNVFQTTDHGIVYIDCTGSSQGDPDDAYDTFGYVVLGKPYGRLHVDLGAKYPSDYRKYEQAKAVFRNLRAWDREITAEQTALQRELKRFETNAPAQDASTVRQVHRALQLRVNKFNHMLEYRNALAKNFRLEYSEDTAPVTRVDVFW